jgi:predicted transcriptional regulator
MNRRLSVRLPDELADGIEIRARRLEKTKSEVVRDALTDIGLAALSTRPPMADVLKRAAAFRARQTEVVDAVQLIREVRGGSLRLRLQRLTVPFMQADLA